MLLKTLIFTCYYAHAQDNITQELEQIERQSFNNRPIIGIMTQPVPWKILNPEQYNYIAASYVKYFESSGARIVPLQWNSDLRDLKETMESINGLFFAGGSTDLIQEVKSKSETKTTDNKESKPEALDKSDSADKE